MQRLRALMGETEFHVLLFFLCIVLFGWPFVSFSDIARLEVMFVYLFIAWTVVIGLLFLVGRSQAVQEKSEDSEIESQ